jgi:sulfate transport system ATP-binding protein
MSIEIKNISKKFGDHVAIESLDLSVASGELVALLGPSGCGKTTLLRIIAGLESADTGTIALGGADSTELSARERQVGFVFQHYALFRHMTVFDNVAFGLKVLRGKAKPSKEAIRRRVEELLAMVQMDWALKRYPNQLSGGQRQRVALARALAVEPRVLLLDEPFSALDAKVRLELRRWLRKLHDELHITSVFVTHDQEEALELADRIVIFNRGRVEQQGSPEEVYDRPANAFVYNFLGNVNVFHGRAQDGETHISGGLDRRLPLPAGAVQGFVRPHDVGISLFRRAPNEIEATLSGTRVIGAMVGLELQAEGFERPIEAEVQREIWKDLGIRKGDRVYVSLDKMAVFSADDYSI